MLDFQKETSIVALSIQESTIVRQIEAAKMCAQSRCIQYNAKNEFWKKVDLLNEKEEAVMEKINNFVPQKKAQASIASADDDLHNKRSMVEALDEDSEDSLTSSKCTTTAPKKKGSTKNKVGK